MGTFVFASHHDNEEVLFISDAIQKVVLHHKEWQKDYQYNTATNEYESIIKEETIENEVKEWFWLE